MLELVPTAVREMAAEALTNAGFELIGGIPTRRRTTSPAPSAQVHARHLTGSVVLIAIRRVKRAGALGDVGVFVDVAWEVWTAGGWRCFQKRRFEGEVDSDIAGYATLVDEQIAADAKVLAAALEGAAT